ncbi:MAG: hypothetical protein R3Y61_04855 [Rikenellaceae bacterium]
MKKQLSTLLVVALCVLSAVAQTPEEIFAKFAEKTKIETFNANYKETSSVCEMEIVVGPVTMPVKVVAKYPGQFRCDMVMQGTNVLVIVNDTTGYVTANSQTQVIEGKEAIAQLIPLMDFANDCAPTIDNFRDLKFVGTTGKGKKECCILEGIAIDSNTKTKLYFNTTTSLLVKLESAYTSPEGKTEEFETSLLNYKEYCDGELYLPSKISTPTPEGTLVIKITNFEVDYPTAPWMFAAPKM